MTPLEVVAPGPSNSVRSDSHPVLEPGSGAFPQGRYLLEFERCDSPASGSSGVTAFSLLHRIENAPLITRLVDGGHAAFACIVSSPLSSYRKTHLSPKPRQEIDCERDDLGQPPMFTPLVVCTDGMSLTLDAVADGVDEIWHGQTVTLNRGSRLAVGSAIRLEASMTELLSMQADESLGPGRFYVDAQTEPFRFTVRLHPGLHGFLRYKSDWHIQRHNIIVNIVTACLALLQRDYGKEDDDGGWESFPLLKAFAGHLEARGIRHWADEEFRPEEAATALYPLELPPEPEGAAE